MTSPHFMKPPFELHELDVCAILESPMDWSKGGGIHNWRNHVGVWTKSIWNTFTDEQKLAIGADACWAANNEDWE